MPEFTLTADVRSEKELGSGPVGRMRRGGVVPGVVYGLGRDSVAVKCDERDFEATLRSMQGMGVIQLTVGNLVEPVLVKSVARHPVTRRALNIDFIRVDLTKSIGATVRVFLSATPRDIAADEMFEHMVHAMPVEGLPDAIPPMVHVDASKVAMRHPLYVRDIPLPEGVTAVLPGDTQVAAIRRAGGSAAEEEAAEETAAVEGAQA
jgi:large subunit ribosomal protein L25